MRTWSDAFARALVSGSVASVASTIALVVAGRAENGRAAAPTNATSHWIWGERAMHVARPTLRHTLVGYVIHHAASIFWATLYEKWGAGRRTPRPVLEDAALVAGLAWAVDFHLTPQRLTPGFERRLSLGARLGVYAAFAGGLAAISLLPEPRSAAPRPRGPRANGQSPPRGPRAARSPSSRA